jgi:ATP-dependent Zn protease
LMKHKDKMDMIVDELMKFYTLYGKDIKKIME